MNQDIQTYNDAQDGENKAICELLAKEILKGMPKAENKLWHGGPVWFLDNNPIVGYSVRKNNVQLLFWSGMSFDEPSLEPVGNVEKFKAAGAHYTNVDQINSQDIQRWLKKSETIQWDYKNIVKRRGELIRLK